MNPDPAQPAFVDSADLYAACGSSDTAVQADAYQVLWAYLYRIAFFMADQQPDQAALAQDCAQRALVRIHHQRTRCREPKAFRTWCRRVVSNLMIDELRRRQRQQPLEETPVEGQVVNSMEQTTLADLTAVSLRQLLNRSPMSDRSRRVVIGRYLDDLDDHTLAEVESQGIDEPVRPSHVQVTRSKNIQKLRQWSLLRDFLQEMVGKE